MFKDKKKLLVITICCSWIEVKLFTYLNIVFVCNCMQRIQIFKNATNHGWKWNSIFEIQMIQNIFKYLKYRVSKNLVIFAY